MPAKAPPKKSKSAKKRVRQTKKITIRNRSVKNKIKSFSKIVQEYVANKKIEEAKSSLNIAIAAIDKAKAKGIIHRNTASRKISQLTRLVNSLNLPGAA